jgi:hypothetical protein
VDALAKKSAAQSVYLFLSFFLSASGSFSLSPLFFLIPLSVSCFLFSPVQLEPQPSAFYFQLQRREEPSPSLLLLSSRKEGEGR